MSDGTPKPTWRSGFPRADSTVISRLLRISCESDDGRKWKISFCRFRYRTNDISASSPGSIRTTDHASVPQMLLLYPQTTSSLASAKNKQCQSRRHIRLTGLCLRASSTILGLQVHECSSNPSLANPGLARG